MHRTGVLISHALPDTVLNDEQDTCEYKNMSIIPTALRQLTASAIRRIMASILMINRHLDLYDLSEEVVFTPEHEAEFSNNVTIYHHEASMEHFYKLHMYWSVPIAGKMQYKHDFPGMFNDISQVIYFHNPDYKRIKREDHTSTSPLHILPSVCLMYPEIRILYEDDCFNPVKPNPNPNPKEWYWVLLPQRIYLVSPEPKVYYSSNLNTLLHVYLNSRPAMT
jgi:hypothetical protein